VAKPEWGTKRLCQACGSKFYDLGKTPIICPECETEFKEVVTARPAAPKPEPKPAKPPKHDRRRRTSDGDDDVDDDDVDDDDMDDDDIDDDDVDLDDDDDDDDDIGEVIDTGKGDDKD